MKNFHRNNFHDWTSIPKKTSDKHVEFKKPSKFRKYTNALNDSVFCQKQWKLRIEGGDFILNNNSFLGHHRLLQRKVKK